MYGRRTSWLAAAAVGVMVTTPALPTGSSLASETPPPSSGEEVTLRFGEIAGGAASLPLIVADDLDLYQGTGINVERIAVEGPALLPSFASDSIDLTFQTAEFFVRSMQADEPLPLICGHVQQDWGTLIAPLDSDLPSVADGEGTAEDLLNALEGRTVGISALGSSQEANLVDLIESVGLDQSALDIVPVGIGAPSIAALEQGQIDVLYTSVFTTQILVGEGRGRVVFRWAQDGPPQFQQSIFMAYGAREDWLEEHSDAAAAFCEVIGEAVAYIQDPANEPDISDLIAEEFNITDQSVQGEIFGENSPLGLFGTDLTCEQIDSVLGVLDRRGQLKPEPDVSCDNLLWS